MTDFFAAALPSAARAEQRPLERRDAARPDADPDRAIVTFPAADAEWVHHILTALESFRLGLVERGAADVASVLGTVGARFLTEGDPVREQALALLPSSAGLSPEMARVVLDGMAADWTEPRLMALLNSEFGSSAVLDEAASGDGARVLTVGPRLCAQFVSGSVPGVSVTALIRSLLVKSPTLLKPGLGDVVLPVLFARALREADTALAEAAAVLYWPGGSEELEDAVLSRVPTVVVYGGDEAVAALRARSPVSTRFRAYHHRVSVGLVGRAALADDALTETAQAVARSVAIFDQRGCVSPQDIFVETGGAADPEGFAVALASAFRSLEAELPTGRLDPEEAARIQQLRGTAELVSTSGGDSVAYHGGENSWTVLFDPDGVLGAACVGRVVRIRVATSIEVVPELLVHTGAHLQTVGVAGLGERAHEVAEALGRLGASRIVPFSEVPFPPAWWHHDGGGPLRDLVRYVDVGV